jgi:hypothetical protein
MPEPSRAVTVYVCVLPAASPLTLALVVVEVATTAEPSYTRYDAAESLLFDSVHDSEALELVVPETVRPVGVAGVVVPLGVVTVTEALFGDSFPAASTAVTVYVCVLPEASPVMVALVDDEVATAVEPSYTLYDAAGSLLFDSVHDSEALELVVPETVRPVGVAGVVVPLGVVADTEALGVDSLPDASTAVTVYVCVLPAASPVMVALVDDEVATAVEPSYTLYDAAGSLLFCSVHESAMLDPLVALAVTPLGEAGVVGFVLCGPAVARLKSANSAVTVLLGL